jgi:hypothetical protein
MSVGTPDVAHSATLDAVAEAVEWVIARADRSSRK